MLMKVLPWRRSILHSQSLTFRLLFPRLSSSSSPFVSHFTSQSSSSEHEEIYDPPFSLIHSENLKAKNKPKLVTKKNSKATNKLKSDKANDVVAKSDLPFDFMYSYSEMNPSVEPIGFREPKRFSPFGPGRIDRKWTGTRAPADQKLDLEKNVEEHARIQGEPLSEEEIAELVEKYRHNNCSRQINLGRGGVIHNTLEDIHSHWKRSEAVRIKCLGVPTLDMDNICFHLEDKSGGKVIYRQMNILLLYRGRNYDAKTRPKIPIMLWKPHAPIYPRLVQNVADGLTFEETKEMRNRGLHSTPLMKLTRNGVYVNVVDRVRTAFEMEDVVRLDCSHAGASDCKKIGVKLRDLVPCVPILFKDDQIILWKGKSIE